MFAIWYRTFFLYLILYFREGVIVLGVGFFALVVLMALVVLRFLCVRFAGLVVVILE